MIHPDVFIAAVSIGAGLFLLAGGAFGFERIMQATVPQMITFSLGRSATRLVLVITGLVFVAIGAWLLRPANGGVGGGNSRSSFPLPAGQNIVQTNLANSETP